MMQVGENNVKINNFSLFHFDPKNNSVKQQQNLFFTVFLYL